MEVDRSKARAEKARHRANGKIVGVAELAPAVEDNSKKKKKKKFFK